MPGRRTVEKVFNMGPNPSRHSYVDRADLDRRVRTVLLSGSHVAMHGESKHGKSWLRARTLPESETARVQCLPGMDASTILVHALGRLGASESLKVTVERTSESESRGGAKFHVKAIEGGAHAARRTKRRRVLEQQPVGADRDDLGWVADQFRERGRTPVFEDFHNLDADDQFAMAYVIKALGDWGVPCVVSGIWTDTHLLKLYNGELDGRIEDLKLQWRFEELKEVVRRGCRALRVEITDPLVSQLARDAYTSVGLLQELTKATLEEAGVRHRGMRTRHISDPAVLETARERVVAGMASRFDPFVRLLPSAELEGVRPGLYGLVTRVVVTGGLSESELLAGVTVDELHGRLLIDDPDVQAAHVTVALESIEAAQRSVSIQPSVLAWDAARQRLLLADRRLLLYLRERPTA
jgi:hypothetical protein